MKFLSELLDSPGLARDSVAIRAQFAAAGYGARVTELLLPFFECMDRATFCGGAFRILPLEGWPSRGMPSLADWNHGQGWKQYGPVMDFDVLWFASNAFGDLFGIPLDKAKDLARNRVAVLWTEKYEYREAGITWDQMAGYLQRGNEYAQYFARIPEFDWARGTLGVPEGDRCFSSNVPVLLGGSSAISNLAVQSLPVHVSFTLQLLKSHAEGRLPAGGRLPLVDLYDQQGKLIAG